MDSISSSIARISSMDCRDIVNLHFAIQEEVKKQYKLRANPSNLAKAMDLCEKSVAISGLVMEAMKKKHREQCDEHSKTLGRRPPNYKFYYPSHYAGNQLCVVLRRQKNLQKEAEIQSKLSREGWNSCRYEEL